MRKLILIIPFFITLITSCNNFESKAKATAPDWEISNPERQGVDSEFLLKMLTDIKTNHLDVHSIMIVRNDKLIFDFHSFPYTQETLHNVKSVSKSIMSGVVGIALDNGLVDSLNTPVYPYFPEYVFNDSKKEITLRHLLTMTSGLDLDENGPISSGIFESDDWIKSTIAQPMVNPPGEVFKYCTGLSHIMSGILTKKSGLSLLELSQDYLFKPLGINNVKWDKGPKGYHFGGSDLWMDINSITKIGYLYLNQGKWRNEQIIPRDWVLESTKGKVLETEDVYYGYWWRDVQKVWKVAMGWGGQYIFYNNDLNTIITVTSADGDDSSLGLILNYIFPALSPSDSLPENLAINQELNQLIEGFKNPMPEPINEFPEIVENISGTTYHIKTSIEGLEDDIESLCLDFNNRQCRLILNQKGESLDALLGLDQIYKLSNDNNVALKGLWEKDSTFNITYHEIGMPFKKELRIEFQDLDNIILKIKYARQKEIVLYGNTKEPLAF